jgi:cytoskeleton protein RodZ
VSDKETQVVESQAVPGPGGPGRQARGTSIAEVAAALKMSPRQIEAIENEDFSRLSGATFVRGFIRNYARLLKIDVAPVLAALAERTELQQAELSAPADEGVKMPIAGHRQGKGLAGAIILASVVLGAAFALYFDVVDFDDILSRKSGTPASQPESRAQIVQPQPQPVAAVQPAVVNDVPAPAATAAGADEQPAAKAGMLQLIFSFDGSSWVEVKDGAGRTIFSQMNAKGTTQTVEGRPPFHLVVGNASQVRLQYRDQPVDLRPHTRVEVARLTLD